MNRTLLGTVAGAALIAGAAGYLIGHNSDLPQPVNVSAPATETAAPPNSIAMDAARIKAADIGLYRFDDGGFGAQVIAHGAIEAPPSGLAVLTAGADGRVTRITKQIGDAVAKLLVEFGRGDGVERGQAMPARMLADHQRVVGVESVPERALFDERAEPGGHGHPSLRVHRVQRMALKEMADVQALPRSATASPRPPSTIPMTPAPRRPPRGRRGSIMGETWVSIPLHGYLCAFPGQL